MRIICILVCFGFYWPEVYPQTSGYTFTPDGSLIFTEVIEVKGSNQNELYENAEKTFFNKKLKKGKWKRNKQDKTLTISKSFSVYENGIISKIPVAEIHFIQFIEFKDERYRYQFKDFNYLPFERNRYGKYEAVQRKRKSLEDLISNDQEWAKLEAEFNTKIQTEIEIMKQTIKGELSLQNKDTVSNIIELKKDW